MHANLCGPTNLLILHQIIIEPEASNSLVDDKNIHFVIMRFKG